MKPKWIEIARQFVKTHRGRPLCADGRGRCAFVCAHLERLLRQHGAHCRMVRCEQPRITHPIPGARWSPWLFHVVLVANDDSWVLDPTTSNIIAGAETVRVTTLVQMQREWGLYRDWTWS